MTDLAHRVYDWLDMNLLVIWLIVMCLFALLDPSPRRHDLRQKQRRR